MAELIPELSSRQSELAPKTAWTPKQTRGQFAAIAWLRWRIAANSLRRKGGKGELIGRILLYPIMAAFAFGPTIGVGLGAWYFASNGHLERLHFLLWATFLLCQFLNLQLGQPGTTFDPTQLIRFPVKPSQYVAVRLAFGVLTPANVIGTMMSLAMAIGVSVAEPALTGYALLAMIVFAATNVLFSRMVFAWVDRWLATRRAREVFTGLIFAVSIGFQYLNFTYNPAYGKHHRGDAAQKLNFGVRVYHRALPFLHGLPPELTSSAMVNARAGQIRSYFGLTLACAAFAAVFLVVFALRMKKEFRGENLSDQANAVAKTRKKAVVSRASSRMSPIQAAEHSSSASSFGVSPVVAAVLGKEFLTLRRNTGLFYGVVAPLVFVFLFAGKLASRGSGEWVFPAAVAYTLLGIAPLSFNSFGLEGAGSQFYFLAPVRMREIFLAKNLMNFGVALMEALAVLGIVSYLGVAPSVQSVASGLLWTAATLLLSTTLGNRRSISAPKKVNLAKVGNKQASPLSAFIGMGVLLASAVLGAGAYLLTVYLHAGWALVPVMLAYAAVAGWVYVADLGKLDRYALAHREELFEELCKAA